MKNYFSIAIILAMLLATGCRVETPAVGEATNDPRFRVAEPNQLFFKNIRQIDYRQPTLESSQPEVYIHVDWPQQQTDHWRLAIEHHWLADEAYLRFIPPAHLTDSTQWIMRIPTDQSQPALQRLDLDSPASQYEAGKQLLQCLLTQKTISLYTEGGSHQYELFTVEADQKSGMTTLHDYFQLVSKR